MFANQISRRSAQAPDAPLNAIGRSIIGAAGNFASATGETVGAPGAAPTTYIFQAVILTSLVSGIFEFGWNFPFNSGTTADAITLTTRTKGWTTAAWATITTTGKHVLTGATAVGIAGANVGPAINAGSAPSVYQCTAAGTTITNTSTGAGMTTSTHTTVIVPTLTGLITANGMQTNSGSAIVSTASGGGGKAAFAIGSPVAFEWFVTATNTITMTGNASFWAIEQAAG